MKKGILLLGAVACAALSQAQSVAPSVVASGGDFFTGSNFTNSFTVGEMTMVETFTQSTFILTQGFQQPAEFIEGISEPVPGFDFGMYPNPTNGQFVLQFTLDNSAEVKTEIFNALGELIRSENNAYGSGAQLQRIDMSAYSSGIYLVRCTVQNNGQLKTTTLPLNLTR